MTNIKPCPFCGGTSVSTREGSSFRWWIAQCDECQATSGEIRVSWKSFVISQHVTDAEALARWNERAEPSPAPTSETPPYQSKECETEMTIEERKMSRPDSRWKAELLNLYRSAKSNRSETTDVHERHYQTGVMTACSSIWNRVTGEQLSVEEYGKRTITLSEPQPAQPRTLTAAEIEEIEESAG